MIKALFITATNTDVGKTYVTALIIKKLRANNLNAGYYKPAASGGLGDAEHVCRIAGLSQNPASLISYLYKTAVAPHLAAQLEGNSLDLSKVYADFNHLASQHDYLVVEGAGGIICPLRMDDTGDIFLTDVIKLLGLGIIIVADAGLGAINSTLLTIHHAKTHGIKVCGLVLNHYDPKNFLHRDNKTQLERLSGIKVIACVGSNDKDLDIEVQELTNLFNKIENAGC